MNKAVPVDPMAEEFHLNTLHCILLISSHGLSSVNSLCRKTSELNAIRILLMILEFDRSAAVQRILSNDQQVRAHAYMANFIYLCCKII